MTRSEKQIFFRGVKKAVGADGDVLEVFERMFPEDLMLDDVVRIARKKGFPVFAPQKRSDSEV